MVSLISWVSLVSTCWHTRCVQFPVELPAHILEIAQSIGIKPEDIDENFIRGGGHGGQKINKTASCVQLFHRPTHTEIRCQEAREQHLNRIKAYTHLILRIEEMVKGMESKLAQEKFKIRKQKQRRSRRAKEKMLEGKRQRGEIKGMRKPII